MTVWRCLHLVRADAYVLHKMDPGNEEISSSRCSQYILKYYRSHSEESYDSDSALQKMSKIVQNGQKWSKMVQKCRFPITKNTHQKNTKLYDELDFKNAVSCKNVTLFSLFGHSASFCRRMVQNWNEEVSRYAGNSSRWDLFKSEEFFMKILHLRRHHQHTYKEIGTFQFVCFLKYYIFSLKLKSSNFLVYVIPNLKLGSSFYRKWAPDCQIIKWLCIISYVFI